MKTIFIALFSLFAGLFLQAQQVSLGEISRTARFGQLIDEVNNGATKINYSDIKGIPYYYPEFINAKIGETSTSAPIRYNSFLDTIEIVNNEDVYQLPKDGSNPYFTFLTTKEKLVCQLTNLSFG